MQISNFKINNESKVFIIAELSANHNGSLENALETIKAAKRAGADCIKLQTYTPDTLTIDSNKPDFIIKSGSIWDGINYYELYEKALSIIIEQQKVSTSFIQRYLQIGYNRAARIVEKMEEDGYISEANNAGKRNVLKTNK